MPTLRPFQHEDVNAIKRHKLRVILASAQGTGKTPITVMSILESARWAIPALVVAPASVTRNWRREFRKWAPGLRVHLIEDTFSPLDSTAHVFITSWALLKPRESELRALGLRVIVGDECHMVKNPEAERSRALYRLTRRVPGLLLLTGTPIINSRAELGVLEALYGKRPHMIRRLLEDVAPDIPPKSRSHLYVSLRERARVEYDRAVDDFEEWLRKKKERLLGEGLAEAAVERAMAAEAFTKMGYLRRLVGEAKAPAAADWIARAVRLGEPVVVFLEHQVVLQKLRKALRRQRIRHCVIEGKTSPKKRQQYIDQFQAHKYPVMLCTKAGKEGITLHAARHLLFVERFFTCAAEEQAEDRIRRIGQRHPTTIWYLHAHDTVDDRLDEIVRAKRHLTRRALRSENTAETRIGNVATLVKQWASFVTPSDRKITNLGHGDPLPSLPPPPETHAVVFTGPRWRRGPARRWCEMHGYLPSSTSSYGGRVKVQVHPVEVFQPRAFSVFRVCQDVKVITGTRLSKRNERAARSRLRHIGR